MKKIIPKLLSTALAFMGLWGCGDDTILIPETPFDASNYVIPTDSNQVLLDKNIDKLVTGHAFAKVLLVTTDATVQFKRPVMPTPPAFKVDLSNLKRDYGKKEADLKMIAIGGGMTAGFRDFGYFNEGMYTSYPNLVAQQMTIEKFELPLFPASEYNGVGRMEKTDFDPVGGPLQKFATVNNNGAGKVSSDIGVIRTERYMGEADNLAFPYQKRNDIKGEFWAGFPNFLKDRIVGSDKSPVAKIKNRDFDFFILESGYDDLIASLTTFQNDPQLGFHNELIRGERGNILELDIPMYSNPEWALIRDVLEPKKVKGVILNMPDVTKLPIVLSGDLIFKNSLLMYKGSPLQYYGEIPYILPSTQVDSLLSPKVNMALKPGINPQYPLRHQTLLSNHDIEPLLIAKRNFQEQAEILSKKYGYAIVDIASLFDKVASKEGAVSDDGITITSESFFSIDGMYPSAIGQAMIANEVIKTINKAYNTKIPLIAIREIRQ